MKKLLATLFYLFIVAQVTAQTNIKLEEVSKHIGDSVTVCGKVADMRYFENSKNQPMFLNMGDKYPNQQLTVVIWGDIRKQFREQPENLLNRQICITGRIILFKEKPEIVIDGPEKIKIQ